MIRTVRNKLHESFSYYFFNTTNSFQNRYENSN